MKDLMQYHFTSVRVATTKQTAPASVLMCSQEKHWIARVGTEVREVLWKTT